MCIVIHYNVISVKYNATLDLNKSRMMYILIIDHVSLMIVPIYRNVVVNTALMNTCHHVCMSIYVSLCVNPRVNLRVTLCVGCN